MVNSLIGPDIVLFRKRYDEALKLQGIPCKYQYPILPDSNTQGEANVDFYSPEIDAQIFFDGSPKVKTFKRYGWVVENSQDLPFLIHCSWNLPNMQKDCIFSIAGMYSDVTGRKFRVTELTYDLQCPDHLVAQVVPVYDNNITGRTDKETKQKFNTSNTFLKRQVDYRGDYYETRDDG